MTVNVYDLISRNLYFAIRKTGDTYSFGGIAYITIALLQGSPNDFPLGLFQDSNQKPASFFRYL